MSITNDAGRREDHVPTNAKPAFVHAKEAERRCLFCGLIFISEWVGNRLCTKCKRLAEFV